MKQPSNTIMTVFLNTPTEMEIKKVAKTMKGSNSYLFKCKKDGSLMMHHRRNLGMQAKYYTFLTQYKNKH